LNWALLPAQKDFRRTRLGYRALAQTTFDLRI
jgi:hypothetical protein